MDNPYNRLKAYLKSRGVEFEHLIFDKSCHSVKEASIASGEKEENFVKNVCMSDESGNLIVAIVLGDRRASTKRVAKVLGIDSVKVATPEFIEQKSGYKIGGVPSFGFDAIFLLDNEVVQKEYILTGGGSEFALVKIDTKNLITLNSAKVCRVRK